MLLTSSNPLKLISPFVTPPNFFSYQNFVIQCISCGDGVYTIHVCHDFKPKFFFLVLSCCAAQKIGVVTDVNSPNFSLEKLLLHYDALEKAKST